LKELGILGLGRMGSNVARHCIEQGIRTVVWNRSPGPRRELAKEGAKAVETPQALVEVLKPPRIILIFLPAGPVVDDMIEAIVPGLSKGDIIIDGGNSHFRDSKRRATALQAASCKLQAGPIHYLDMGTSGGLSGARHGACLTIGGDEKVFKECEWVFKAIAQKGGYAYVGPQGAGHYVKMVHNGIEYALLQSYGEGFQVLAEGPYSSLDFAKIAKTWSNGSIIRSYLLELAAEGLRKDTRLKNVEGKIGGGETGTWTVEEAKKAGTPTPMMYAALKARSASQKKPTFATKVVAVLRNLFGGHSL
jgi:6-phosphogluconate dehydrogenase